MPVIETGGAMTIVAHQDDDILFMNPDIAHSIAAGEPNTTIFVTAGDSGLDDSYWIGREDGAKAAYSVMAGSDQWVDEVMSIGIGGTEFEIATSYLADQPDVRLYFLRLPDGGGLLVDEQVEQLGRLESGDLASVTTIDGTNTYARDDLVNALSELMELHAPADFRLQVADGTYAAGEHTDHVHTTIFAEEALAAYSGENYTVTQYVQYQSGDLAPNLSPEDAALSLEVMQAYAAHDPAVLDGSSELAQVYADWTDRVYVANEYTVVDGVGGPDSPDTPDTPADPVLPDTPPADGTVFSLTGADAFLFTIDPATGAVAPQDWFTPALDDAWDQNEDHVYEVTVLADPGDGSAPVSLDLWLETTAEGVLTPLDDAPSDAAPSDPAVPDDPEPPVDPTTPDDPVLPDTPPADGTVFSLTGADAFLFTIDPATGAVAPQDWFTPALDDAWDQNEDHVYEVTQVSDAGDGSAPVSLDLWLETTAEGVLTPLDDAPSDTGAPDPAEPDEPGTPDDPVDPLPSTGETLYGLTGPDAQLFVIDPVTGTVTPQDWFLPSYDDAWDVNEDNIYEITRTTTPLDGNEPVYENIWLEVTPDDQLVPVAGGATLMARLFDVTQVADQEFVPQDDGAAEDTMSDVFV